MTLRLLPTTSTKSITAPNTIESCSIVYATPQATTCSAVLAVFASMGAKTSPRSMSASSSIIPLPRLSTLPRGLERNACWSTPSMPVAVTTAKQDSSPCAFAARRNSTSSMEPRRSTACLPNTQAVCCRSPAAGAESSVHEVSSSSCSATIWTTGHLNS